MASQTIKGLTVQIGGDTTKFSAAIKHAEDESKKLSRELTDVNKLLKADPGNINLLAQKQQILTEKVAATKEKLDTLKQAEAQVQAQFEKGDITAEQYRAFQREIQYTANEMQGYEKAIEKTTKQLAEAKVKTGEEASSLEMLNAKISLQEQELAELTNKYKNAVLAEGENSETVKDLKEKYNQLNSELTESKQKMTAAETAAASLGKAEEQALTPLESLKKTISEQEKELDQLNTEYQNAVVQYGKNSTQAKELATKIKNLSEEHQNEKAKLQEAEKATQSITATEKTLTEQYEDQKSELSTLKQQYINVAAQYGENSKEAKELAKQIDSLSGELAEEEKKIKQAESSADKFDKTLADTSDDAKQASNDIEDLGDSAKDAESSFSTAAVAVGEFMGNLAIELLQRATELIKNFASGTVETGKTFEASMSKVKAISGATTSELKDLDAVARQYGRDTQFSASECADALTYMALAGWKVDDMIKALPGVLNLAAASEMDLAKASDVVTDYMTAFGWEANRAGEFADKMAFAMANSNTDTEMLGEAYKNCASTADS
ncbi:MAG: phage tail tape measure protein, partial [Oscillospiraceae bacterium]|nr:phage tail tape measure protein [Oscillospiraceae bacterium]